MLSDIVKAGQIVEIQPIKTTASPANDENKEDKEEEKKVFRTKVFDVLSEDKVEIVMPTEKTKLIVLPVGGEFDLCFCADNALYQCYAKVTDRYKSNNVSILVMELSSNLRKHQRREFYRFSCALKMESRELDHDEIRSVEGKTTFLTPGVPLKRSVIVDISGGGLRFIADHRYAAGSLICCNFSLVLKDVIKEYSLVGKVLAATELDKKPGVYEHRVQYVNLSTGKREEIIKYIFQEERKQRHKESEYAAAEAAEE